MANTDSTAKKGPFQARVYANRQIGRRIYRLSLEFSGAGAGALAGCQAGQFAQLELSSAALPKQEAIPDELADAARRNVLLRRPFSFADVSSKAHNTLVDILYCALGPASLRMTTLSTGDSISIIGPLGRGFWVPQGKKTALLAAGGMGAGPLLYLAKVLTADYPDIKVTAFAGAKTTKELPFERKLDEISQGLGFSLAEFANYGIESLVATDDGSAGYQGLVTDCIAEWLAKAELPGQEMVMYCCGPEAMLARMAKIAAERRIDCQMSMERRMACGIGVCQSCVVECRSEEPGQTIYKLCCEDGPVFDSREVVFRQ